MMPTDLANLQRRLYRLLTAPGGVDEGLAAERAVWPDGLGNLIRGDSRLDARDRLAIYADAYFYRLLDVLREDYPATAIVLGAAQFHNLITGYVLEYPPASPLIQDAGRSLAGFLRSHPLSEDRPWLADLARMERALSEVFHAADAEPLDHPTLSAVAPADWPAIRLRLHPAAQIIEFDHHVEQIVEVVNAGRSPSPPVPESFDLLVWRSEGRAHYRRLDADEAAALTVAAREASFAEMCEVVAERAALTDPAAAIAAMLRRWVSGGILIRGAAA